MLRNVPPDPDAAAETPPAGGAPVRGRFHHPRMRPLFRTIAAVAIVFIGGACLLVRYSPFRREALVRRIERDTGARVEIGSFDLKWFPAGFHAKQVRILHPGGVAVAIGSITVSASYIDLLRKPQVLDRLEAAGIAVQAPPGLMRSGFHGRAGFRIGVRRLHIADSTLEFRPPRPGTRPVQFAIHSLTLERAGTGGPLRFHVQLHLPRPAGEIRSDGELGRIQTADPLETPVRGSFVFEHADISIPRAIAGTLAATGKFNGPLRAIACAGAADVPDFQVFGSVNPVRVVSQFDVTVNARTADVTLNRVASDFRGTTVLASGRIASEPAHPGKTTRLDIRVDRGRLEDLLLLFSSRRSPAMRGSISFNARFEFPTGPPDFLTRLRASGDYRIEGAYFTNAKTQDAIDRLSASARRESGSRAAPLVTAEVRGRVSDAAGIATLRPVDFAFPAIAGQLSGTFDLHRKTMRFEGEFSTSGKLTRATSGPKKLALSIVRPLLWPRRHGVTTAPFQVTGSASHPVFTLEPRSQPR